MLSLSVQSSVEISVTTVSIPNGLNGNAFGISPLSVFPSPSNTIMFALNSNSDTPSAQGRILRACFFALAIMLIIIGWSNFLLFSWSLFKFNIWKIYQKYVCRK